MSDHAHNNGDDVEVIRPPKRIAKHVPDYTTVQMTYFDYVDLSNATSNQSIVTRHYIRLNSIYDVPIDAAGTSATNDVDADNLHAPAGRGAWENIYKYYRVLKSEVSLHFVNNSEISYSTTGVDHFVNTPKIVGYIPTDDTSNTTAPQHWTHWIERKHSKADLIDPGFVKNTTATANYRQAINHGLGLNKKQNFTYTPATWDYHITDDAEDERWTLLTQAPVIKRNLCIMATSAANAPGSGNFGNVYNIRCYYHIKYTVQLRELKDDLLFKTSSAPTTEN